MVMLWLALGLVSLTSIAGPAAARKLQIPLSAAVDESTFVCIGTVERVETITLPPNWSRRLGSGDGSDDDILDPFGTEPTRATFGRIAVARVLKGDPTTKVAYHETWPTWTCDTTSAHVGERCLFFLCPGQAEGAAPDVRESIVALLGGAPVYSNVGSGDGIVPILTTAEGEPYVRFAGAPKALGFPESTVPAALRSDKWHGRQPLAGICTYVEEVARFAPELAVIRATSRSGRPPQWKAFDFRMLGDGSVRVATNFGAEEFVRVSKLETPAWSALRDSITTTLGPEPISLGEPDSYNPYRSLRIRLPDARLSFVDDDSVIVSGMADAELATYRRVIRAWAVVREAVDCLDCVDHRSADKGWLAR